MNIVVLCGGLSIERDVSLTTGALVTEALLKKGHNAVVVDVVADYDVDNDDYIGYIESCRDRELVIPVVPKIAPDVVSLRAIVEAKGKGLFGKNVLNLCMASDTVFMGLHGGEGEDGRIQATLDMFGVKYTGSDSLGSAIAMSKKYSKQIYDQYKILSPRYFTLEKDELNEKVLNAIKIPAVVKISSGGSSLGVYIAHDRDELRVSMGKAFDMEDSIVIEEYIKGVEYTCGVFGGQALPIVEIRPKVEFYDYESKYQAGATAEICPAPSLDEEQTKQMQKISLRAHYALGLSVYSRTDFIISDDDGQMYCIESNTLPGMTPTSLLPQEAAAVGIDYVELCHRMIILSLEKYDK